MRLLTVLLLAALAGCAHRSAADVPAGPQRTPEESAAASARRGDYREAVRLYGEILKEHPRQRVARLGLGEAWLGLGAPRPALAAFEEVLKAEPLDAGALEGSALALLGQHQYARAEERLLRVLMQRPDSWRALNGMGLLADMKGDYPAAQAWYEKALAVREGEASLYNNYGYSLLMAGDPPRAELLLTQAMRLSPRNGRVRNNLMQAIAWQGNYERAVSLRGELPLHTALNNVGYIAALRQDRAGAARLFQRALDASPNWYATAAANLERLQQPSLAGTPAAPPPKPRSPDEAQRNPGKTGYVGARGQEG